MNMFKTTNAATPEEYIAALEEPRRSHIQQLHDFIRKTVPQYAPHLQSGMLAYGTYHYKYASGREGDWMPVALASQKNYISLYVMAIAPDGKSYLAETYKDKLPKANIGRSCIRFKKPEDLDLQVVAELLTRALEPQT
jgi:hypothetical protein